MFLQIGAEYLEKQHGPENIFRAVLLFKEDYLLFRD